jgi:hypothetical protein
VTIDDPVSMARELLMTDDVVVGKGQAPHMLATAQTWATLAVAEASPAADQLRRPDRAGARLAAGGPPPGGWPGRRDH